MKKCRNCGNDLLDSMKFCPACGMEVTVNEQQNDTIIVEYPTDIKMSHENNAYTLRSKPPKKSKSVYIIVIVVLIAIVATIVIVMKQNRIQESNDSSSLKAITEIMEQDVSKNASPEDFIIEMYQDYFVDSLDMEGFWKDCVSEKSKELGVAEKEDYTMELYNIASYYKVVCNSISVEDVVDRGNGMYSLETTIDYSVNGINQREKKTFYVINENGEYKLLLDGATSRITYNADNDYDGNLIMNRCYVFYGLDSISLKYYIENNTDYDFVLGLTASAKITITTEEGLSYSSTNDYVAKFNAGETGSGHCVFKDIVSTITYIEITPVYFLDSNGFPDIQDENSIEYNLSKDIEDSL